MPIFLCAVPQCGERAGVRVALEVVPIQVSDFQQNCRLLCDRVSGRAVVIDPGGEASRIETELARHGCALEAIWLTHSHLDHCGGVADLLDQTAVPLIGHPGEAMMRSSVVSICAMYGIAPGSMRNCPEPSRMVSGGEVLEFAGERFEVIFTPGHSPGHVCFYNAEAGYILSGDVLFQGSIGRTDLPGGSFETLMESIQGLMKRLPDATRVMSGHGPDTTIGRERRSNPFIQGQQ